MAEIDTFSELAKRSYKMIGERSNNTDGFSKDDLHTGFQELDKVSKILRPGSLITVGGVAGMGKTAFVYSILYNLSIKEKIPTLLFSAEMYGEEAVNRLISKHCSIPLRKILYGQLTKEEWARFDKGMQTFNGPLYIENTHHLYIDDVIRIAEEAVRQKKVKLIAIDYLQMMYYRDKMNESRYTEINSIICKLKSLAMQLHVPIIVVSLLNRKIDDRPGKDGKRPILSDLRDTGTISDDSDVVIFVHRPEYYHIYEDVNGNPLKGMALICIAKDRYLCSTADVTLCF